MRIPSWVLITTAVVAALPFGWGLGVLVAYLIAGPNFGQLPVLTVPISLVVSVAFALLPVLSPGKRLTILAGGAAAFVVLGALVGPR